MLHINIFLLIFVKSRCHRQIENAKQWTGNVFDLLRSKDISDAKTWSRHLHM